MFPLLQAYPNVYLWTSYPIALAIDRIWEHSRTFFMGKTLPHPIYVELCAVAERALNYLHTGNAKVIATSVMNPLWIGQAIVKDGIPCFNPRIIHLTRGELLDTQLQRWPWDELRQQPRSASRKTQLVMWNEGLSKVRLSDSILCQLP